MKETLPTAFNDKFLTIACVLGKPECSQRWSGAQDGGKTNVGVCGDHTGRHHLHLDGDFMILHEGLGLHRTSKKD